LPRGLHRISDRDPLGNAAAACTRLNEERLALHGHLRRMIGAVRGLDSCTGLHWTPLDLPSATAPMLPE